MVVETDELIRPNEIIATISSFMGRDRIILGRRRLTYERRRVFGLASVFVRNVDVDDILHVAASVGPMFGMLHLDLKSKEIPSQIGLFWRNDTIRMTRIIQGYIESIRQKVNLNDVPLEKLVPMLIKAGVNDPTIKVR